MKSSHIILIVLIGVLLATILTFTMSAATYGNFEEALQNHGKTYTVSGYLNKNKPIETPQPNLVIFYMKDKKDNECKVYLNQTKPTDFERSESVVITGKADLEQNAFYATSIQLKCPSKYNDQM